MTKRTITLTLTDAQFYALASAINLQEVHWEQDGEDHDRKHLRALMNASDRLHAAWREKGRSSGSRR